MGVVPSGSDPVSRTAIGLGRFCASVCVASTWATSVVPMPHASAPNAPSVAVWLSPHTTVEPGSTSPFSAAVTWTMPWRGSPRPKSRMPDAWQLRSQERDQFGSARVGTRVTAWLRGDDVIVHGERVPRLGDAAPGGVQLAERFGAAHFVHEMAIDGEQVDVVIDGIDDMRLPDLVEQRSRFLHGCDRSAPGLIDRNNFCILAMSKRHS